MTTVFRGQSTGPQKQSTGPQKQNTGPQKQNTGPQKQSTGPQKQSTGPQKQSTGPQKQSTGPQKQSTGSQKQKHRVPHQAIFFVAHASTATDNTQNHGSTSTSMCTLESLLSPQLAARKPTNHWKSGRFSRLIRR